MELKILGGFSMLTLILSACSTFLIGSGRWRLHKRCR